jgi:DUF4097 and DUF4098 domain-containing protein YvlB
MLLTVAALAALLQVAPPAPTPRPPRPPRVKVHAPETRWGRDRSMREGQTRDTTVAARQGQRLEVNNFSGSITVTAWNQDRVRIVSAAGGDPFTVEGGAITIEVSTQGEDYGGPGEAELSISVPAWMDLELSGNEVDISTRGSRGKVEASTVEGDVTIDGGTGSIEVSSVEGDITISNAQGRVELSTYEGQVSIRAVSGEALDISTVDGDIDLSDVTSANISANTVDGDMSWGGRLSPTGAYRFSTHDGDILLTLDGEPDATVSVDTFDGELTSDWPVVVQRGGTGHGGKMTFTLGAGRARLELSSFDGTIALKRASGR